MAKTTLVGPEVETGAEVLRLLDEAGFPVTVALWLLREEDSRWELTLASPVYDKFGPSDAYGRLLAALKSMDFHTINRLRIRLLGHKDPLIRGLRRSYGKDDWAVGKNLRGPAPGSKIWIEDSFVYRIK